MAEEQISFYSTNDMENLNLADGAVVFAKRDEERKLADLYAVFNGDRYKVKPSYTWNELEDIPLNNFTSYLENLVQTAVPELILRYLIIEKQQDEQGDTVLKISINHNM